MNCSDLLLRDVEVDGVAVDVLISRGRVATVGRRPEAPEGVTVIDGRGGALIPGLHDHHLHLLAIAAAQTSVDCAGVGDRAGLLEALQQASGDWVRGVGYDERISGRLDRHVLDELVPDRPARVQHRTGSLWILNSAALDLVGDVLDDSPDVERDLAGVPNGRLWRYDRRLRAALPPAPIDLRPVGRELLRYGVTGVTDATPELDSAAVDLLSTAHQRGDLPQHITLLGASTAGGLPAGMVAGPWKVHLRDHDLPRVEDLERTIAEQHRRGRPVAVHCVTAEALVLTVAALEACGAHPGDRIEHASVVLPGMTERLAGLGVAVVTQPDLVHHRGDAYLAEVEPGEQPYLYPYRSLLAAGVRVAPSSDAPHAPADPWQTIATAATRRTSSGASVAPDQAVSREEALDGFLSSPLDPGGAPRRVTAGGPADLCLLHVPLSRALADAPRNPVRLTVLHGLPYRADDLS